MLAFKTTGFSGTGVQYSPFLDNRLVVSASANFGLVGNGRLFVLDVTADGNVVMNRSFDTQDSICGVAWSEAHENHVVAAGGDGTIRLFDVTSPQAFPLQAYPDHAREVLSVNWNLRDKRVFCSSSWDGSIKIWGVDNPHALATLETGGHPPATNSNDQSRCVYDAKYSPHEGSQILAAYADSTARLWDVRAPNAPAMTVSAVLGGDCLTVDWNKYRQTVIATAGVDKAVKIWDIRNLNAPTNEFRGHQFAVRSVKWSPHTPVHLLSVSYDMTAKVWMDSEGRNIPGRGLHGLVTEFNRHTEFVSDCDWSLWGQPGWIATVGWDQMLYMWRAALDI